MDTRYQNLGTQNQNMTPIIALWSFSETLAALLFRRQTELTLEQQQGSGSANNYQITDQEIAVFTRYAIRGSDQYANEAFNPTQQQTQESTQTRRVS